MADRAEHDPLGEFTLNYLRTLPDGQLTRAEVNLLIDYIEKLEARLLQVGQSERPVSSGSWGPRSGLLGPKCPQEEEV